MYVKVSIYILPDIHTLTHMYNTCAYDSLLPSLFCVFVQQREKRGKRRAEERREESNTQPHRYTMTPPSPLLFLFLLSLLLSPSSSSACKSATDCSLNGDCDPITQRCVCDSAWKGSTCSTLNLLPLSKQAVVTGAYRPREREARGARGRTRGRNDAASPYKTSWGASVLKSEEDGLYHMFVSELTGNCTCTPLYVKIP